MSPSASSHTEPPLIPHHELNSSSFSIFTQKFGNSARGAPRARISETCAIHIVGVYTYIHPHADKPQSLAAARRALGNIEIQGRPGGWLESIANRAPEAYTDQ